MEKEAIGHAVFTNSTGSSFSFRIIILQITTAIDIMHNEIQALASRHDRSADGDSEASEMKKSEHFGIDSSTTA